MKRIVKRVFIFFFLFIVSLIIGLYAFVVTHEQEILSLFEKEANKYIQTEIHIKSKSISFWEHFPDISIHFENVRIKGSNNVSEQYLAHFSTLDFDFNLIEIIQKKYKIHKIYASNGGVFLYINEENENNYTFFKSSDTSSSDVKFDIQLIGLENIDFLYKNDSTEHVFAIQQVTGKGKFSIDNELLKTNLIASSFIQNISIGNNLYFSDKNTSLDITYLHNLKNMNGNLAASSLKINKSTFELNGEVQPENDRYYFNITSKKTNLNTLFSLLPNSIIEPFQKYKSSGEVTFVTKILKKTEDIHPSIHAKFNLDKMRLIEPTTQAEINSLSLNGSFSNGKLRNNSTSTLSLNSIKGLINNKQFSGNLEIVNFDDLEIKTDLNGAIDLAPLSKFINSNQILNVKSGFAELDFHLDAKLSDLKNGDNNKINTFGEISFSEVNFNYKNAPINLKNGSLLFNNNNISANNFSATIKNSDFNFNGTIINFFPSLMHGKKEMIIDLNCNSKHLQVDSLLKYFITDDDFANDKKSEPLQYRINVKADAQTLHFNQFKLEKFVGKVAYHNDIVTMPKVVFKEANGIIEVQAKIDFRNKENVKVQGIADFNSVDVKQLFTLFNNFDQDFIVANNLEGNLFLDVKTNFELNKMYQVIDTSIVLEAACKIQNGKLLDFEPMQNLSKFIKRGELNNISFSEIANTIQIKNNIITIPEMDISSSVSEITVSGTHTFDQKINYKLKIPMKNFSSPDKDASFGAIEEKGNSSIIHLKITGTTDNYKIAYDTKATSEKLNQNLKDEIKEFKNIIKGKIEQDTIKQTELEEDEYFDF